MPHFAMIGKDGPRGLELRKVHRPAHLAALAPLAEAGRLLFAGPLKDESGRPCGSVVIFEAATLDEAKQFVARDPYVENGVFASVEVVETLRVLPES
jgi:uncharacterized protein YciI